ncbi:MAG: hypothetical protein U9Q68_09755 [Euryarchaeota archaeon]|nr:hypothetical protein [Euryarchaeota archaeon]
MSQSPPTSTPHLSTLTKSPDLQPMDASELHSGVARMGLRIRRMDAPLHVKSSLRGGVVGTSRD